MHMPSIKRILTALSTGALIGGLALGSAPASAQNLTLMSGSAGGTWDGLSGAMKKILETSIPGMSIAIRPGGSVTNVEAVGMGKAQLGWMLSTITVDAANGRPPFKAKQTNVCNIATFHPTVVQYVTNNPDVKTLDDAKGKRIATLPRGTGTELLARQMLSYHGLKPDDLAQYNYASFNDAATMLKDGHIDLFMGSAGMPAGAMMDMFSSISNLRMLSISDTDFTKMHDSNAAWSRYTIKAGTYPHLDQDVVTAAFPTHFGASCDLPEETAYKITKAILKNYKDLGSVITAISHYTPKDLTKDIGIPFHPGAIRAYKEAGVM